MYAAQVRFVDLLADPIFRKWFATPPREPFYMVRWRVYAQLKEEGPWSRRDFDTWREGYNFVAKNFKRFYDCTLMATNWPSNAPIVSRKEGKKKVRAWYRPMLSMGGHLWCRYCRRPTVFREYSRHHFNRGRTIQSWVRRCTICGISEHQRNVQYYRGG